MLWEQEVGSSNLSTPTDEKPMFSIKSPREIGGFVIYHIYSLLFINSHKGDTELWDTLFQFNKLNEKKATQPRNGRGRAIEKG